MTDGREYTPPTDTSLVHRTICRCATCRAWWSVEDIGQERCPCGGELVPVDMAAHLAGLPAAKAGESR